MFSSIWVLPVIICRRPDGQKWPEAVSPKRMNIDWWKKICDSLEALLNSIQSFSLIASLFLVAVINGLKRYKNWKVIIQSVFPWNAPNELDWLSWHSHQALYMIKDNKIKLISTFQLNRSCRSEDIPKNWLWFLF